MASIIRIKRSSTNGNPSTLAAGELAYSALSGTISNGGDRLYIGMGTETAGNAANHVVVGGKYFTDMMDHTPGTLTASSAILVDSNSKIDTINVSNLTLTGNTISSTDTNGNILLDPAGTGYVQLVGTNGVVLPVGTTAQRGPSVQGTVRYNTDTSSFEGYSGTNWGSLGGVKSVDGLTYISAESSPGASDDILHFYASNNTAAVEIAQMNTTKVAILQTTASTSSTTGALTVAGGAGIAGNVYVGGNLNVAGSMDFVGGATFEGNLTLVGSNVAATEYFKIQNGSAADKFTVDSASGNTTIAGTLGVTGATTLSSTLGVSGDLSVNTNKFTVASATGNTTIAGTLGVTGNTTLSGTLGVTGAATLSSTLGVTGDFAVATNKFTVASATGNTVIAGTVSAAGDLAINTNKFTVTAASGNTSIAGTLSVTGTSSHTGNATFGGTLGVTGATTLTGLLTANGGVSVTGGASVTGGLVSTGSYSGSYSDGIILDYVAGTARISAGTGDTIAFYNNADTTRVKLAEISATTVDVGSKRITSVAEPTQATDAATKNYVDAVKTGLDPKDSVRLGTTANLNATYNNGTSGVGATLTNAGAQAVLTLDSIPAVVGDRILVKDQTTAFQNGIYVVTNIGSASTNWVLTRSTDADNKDSNNATIVELSPGAFTFVEEGTNNGQNGYVCNNSGVITVGTTAISWVQFSGAGQVIAGGGLTKTGNQLDVIGTANRITVNADSVDIASTYIGQTSITTLGTIATGTWQGTIVSPTYGGTGVNNGSNTLTIGGNVTHAGAFTQTFTATANTSVTLPTTGTLATLAGTESLSNKTITASSFSGTTVTASGAVSLTGTTDSSSTSTGILTVAGGVGIAKSVYVGVNITGSGASSSNIDGFTIDGGTY